MNDEQIATFCLKAQKQLNSNRLLTLFGTGTLTENMSNFKYSNLCRLHVCHLCWKSPNLLNKSLYSVSCRVRENAINVKNAVFDKFLIILALLINSANVIHRMISFCLSVRVYTSDVRVYLHIVELWSHVKTYVKARCDIFLHSRQPFRGIWVVYR